MSVTMPVPAAVPSDFHNSYLLLAPTTKNNVPLTAVGSLRPKLDYPGAISSIITVPSAVPSDFHSSLPWIPSLAEKNSVPLTFVNCAR